MKRLLIGIITVAIMYSCQSKHDGFLIQGTLSGSPDGSAALKRRINSEFITIDSTNISEGKFKLKGKLELPEMCYIAIADTLPYIRIFLENSEITVNANIDSLRNPDITGSAIQAKLDNYNDKMQPFNDELQANYKEFMEANKEGNKEKAKEIELVFDEIAAEQKIVSLETVKQNSDNTLGPYLVWGTLVYDLTVEELDTLVFGFSQKIDKSTYVVQIQNHINTLKKVAIGQPFTDIVMEDQDGNIMKLSELRGKLVLVDFWASWCGPCRRENPNVVTLYNDYKDQNFEIFGVSFDSDGDKWKKAIQDDSLSWKHVSDLKGWNSEAGKLYGVRSIPHTVLISPEGIIIEKNLRGDALREKVTELVSG